MEWSGIDIAVPPHRQVKPQRVTEPHRRIAAYCYSYFTSTCGHQCHLQIRLTVEVDEQRYAHIFGVG